MLYYINGEPIDNVGKNIWKICTPSFRLIRFALRTYMEDQFHSVKYLGILLKH